MQTAPWWFTPLLTLLATVLGGAVSIIAAWLTQRYNLRSQLALRQADAEIAAAAALKLQREKRYLSVVQNIESLYTRTQNQAGKTEFLKAVREIWLLGDQDLVRKVALFLTDTSGRKEVDTRGQLFGDVALQNATRIGPTD